jgi:two-component sensor histidine kinase
LNHSAKPIIANGKITEVQSTIRNITLRKLTEYQIKKDLKIQTALIQEIYHRTKNNMAVISAMLSMQSRHSDNEFVKSTFKEIKNKIQAMSLVHQKLYKAKDLSNINLKDYIEDLANLIMQSYGVLSEKITMKFDLQDVKISIDSAVPLGLIINELVSNIFKHAFPNRQEGEIFIRLFKEEDETINLELIDNGIGFPQNFDPRKDGSMGFASVFSIVENQLKGEISVKSENGLKWHIKIKDDKKKERI